MGVRLGVDYIVNQPCRVKETLSVEGMVALIRQRYRAVAVIEAARRHGQSDQQAMGATFQIMLPAPGGTQAADVKVSGLLAGTEKLDALQAYCECCPASGGRHFGCYRIIGYPISRKAEEWLAAAARKAAARGRAITPPELIAEAKADCCRISNMRADREGAYFELKRPLEVPIATGAAPDGRKTINTDQLFAMALGPGRIREGRMKTLLQMTGGLTISKEEPAPGTYQVAFIAPGDGSAPTWGAYRLADEPGDDTSTRELKGYFRMMALALALRRDMTVSL